MKTYHFDVNFKSDLIFNSSIEVEKETPIEKVVELCKDELRECNKRWQCQLGDLSYFRVYYAIGIEEYDVFGFDLSM